MRLRALRTELENYSRLVCGDGGGGDGVVVDVDVVVVSFNNLRLYNC